MELQLSTILTRCAGAVGNNIGYWSDFAEPENILNVYLWGSRIYGTATPESDWDIVVVTKDDERQIVPVLSGKHS